MTTQNTGEKITAIRWLAILCLLGLGVADYGLDVMAKPVPSHAYWTLAAIAAGITFADLRKALLHIGGFRNFPKDPGGTDK